jgi:putative Mg2+ transporter-C (MgtC) family protein
MRTLRNFKAQRHARRSTMATEVLDIIIRLVAAGLLGACIGFERRIHHKAVGIAGMVLIAIGSTTYMLLGRHLAELDPSSISRTLQGFLPGSAFSAVPSPSRAVST